MKPCRCSVASIAIAVLMLTSSGYALTASEVGFIDATAAPYGAKGDGVTNDYGAIQNALDAANANGGVVFLPSGDYLVNNTLSVYHKSGLVGSCKDPGKRTRIIVADNASGYGNPGTPKAVVENDMSRGGADTWNVLIQHFDIIVGEGNAGAVGVDLDGAENCGIYDVKVDLSRSGYIGFAGGFASGGINADLSVKGGAYGFYFDNNRPSPTLVGCTFEGQSKAVLFETKRGSHVFVGCEFVMPNGTLVHEQISGQDMGGTAVYVDCKIAYESAAGENTLFTIGGRGSHNTKGILLNDVYVRYADYVLPTHAGKNPDGWVHYKEWGAVNTNDRSDVGVWANGAEVAGQGVYLPAGAWETSDTYDGPANLCSKHHLPMPFPSWETDNAVSIADYGSHKDGDDWAPAINAAIAAADANGSNVVVVPKGDHVIHSTVTLKRETKLVGIHQLHSKIEGIAHRAHVFWGDETDKWQPYDQAPVMIETPDDASATCYLADVGIRPNERMNDDWTWIHTGFGTIRWRCGRNSIIKNVNVHATGKWRGDRAFKAMFDSLNITHVASGITDGNLEFHSDAAQKYHIQPAIPSRIMVEEIQGNKRIAAKSIDSLNADWTGNVYRKANMTIKGKNGAGDWTLSSLKIANAHLDPHAADSIEILGYNNGSVTEKKTLDWRDEERDRTTFYPQTLNWGPVDSVVILSAVPFAIDDVEGNGATATFSGVNGTAFSDDGAFDFNNIHGICKALPLGYEAYPMPETKPKIYFCGNGGGRLWCYVTHGIQFMSAPYVAAENTTEPINIYHLHAQHCPNPQPRFVFENADNISIFGAKNELQFDLCAAVGCDNFRWYGGGGLYNPAAAHNAVRIEECTNYLVAAIDWQLYGNDGWTRHDYWNEMLSRDFESGTTEPLVAYHGGRKMTPGPFGRPLLWKYGTAHDAWTVSAHIPASQGSSVRMAAPGLSVVRGRQGVLRIHVSRNTAEPRRVDVSIVNLFGREVYRASTARRQATFAVDTRRIGSQLLLCRVRSGNRQRLVRIQPVP